MKGYHPAFWSRWPRQFTIYQSAWNRRFPFLYIRLIRTNPQHKTEFARRFAKEHGL